MFDKTMNDLCKIGNRFVILLLYVSVFIWMNEIYIYKKRKQTCMSVS